MLCIYCKDREATSKCVTCQRCRGYMHRWGKESDHSKVARHFRSRALHLRLLGSVSVVVDEDDVRFIDEQELVNARVMYASKLKRKACAVIVSIKKAEAMRRGFVSSLSNVVPISQRKAS